MSVEDLAIDASEVCLMVAVVTVTVVGEQMEAVQELEEVCVFFLRFQKTVESGLKSEMITLIETALPPLKIH